MSIRVPHKNVIYVPVVPMIVLYYVVVTGLPPATDVACMVSRLYTPYMIFVNNLAVDCLEWLT